MEEIEDNGIGNDNGGDLEPGVSEKSLEKDLFRIGEVSRLTATKPFVLRYWETEFPMLQPIKSPKGHRLYRREDIDTVFTIKRLLYNEGFTIAGARRHLRDQALGTGATAGTNGGAAVGASATEVEAQVEESAVQATPTLAPNLAVFNRQTLMDLRDSLRSLLTALESE